MSRTLRNWMALSLLGLMLMGASAQQGLEVPWWVWLVVISVVLLLVFVIVIALAWRDTGRGDK